LAGCAPQGTVRAPDRSAASPKPLLPPAFTEKPAARREGKLVRISFAVSRFTDVAVSIENARGKAVRHLAAGVMGKNPPPPLAADSLRQSLTWDGDDDYGKPARGGPFSFRVALGLAPAFEKLIGSNPADLGSVRGLAPAPDGKLYVLHCYGGHHPHDGTTAVSVLSREGRYLKTIWPFPANLPDHKLAGVRTVKHSTGRSPFVYQMETRSFLPGLGDLPTQRPVVTRDGRLAFVGIQEGPRPFSQPGEARLTVIGTDGSVPAGGALKTRIWPLTDTGASLALSPGERTIYAAGIRAGRHKNGPHHLFVCDNCDHGGATWKHTDPLHAIFRFRWRDRRARPFIGSPRRAGKGPRQLDTPVSVAVDRTGNVYVADLGNQRISVFDEAGRPLARIPVGRPHRVEVSRKTGAIYVLSGKRRKRVETLDLVKFDGWRGGREVTRIPVYKARWGIYPVRRPTMALDESADPTLVWVSSPFLRIEDRGKAFGEPRDLRDKEWIGRHSIKSPMEISLDRERGWLYVNNSWRYDTGTGEWLRFRTPGGRMWPNANPGSANGAAGRDGYYYSCLGARGSHVYRFDSRMRMVPFPTSDRHANKPWTEKTDGRLQGFSRNRGRGLTADRHGNVYVIWKKGGAEVTPGDYHRANSVYLYGPDGKLLKPKLVDAQICSVSHVRVDPRGNVYLAVGLRPGRERLPPGLAGRVPAGRRDRLSVNGVNSYPLVYGSIVKFPPEGGLIRVGAGGVKCNYANGRPVDVNGAEWIFSGCSVAASVTTPKRAPGTIITCICESPCIDVDDFGRCFFPDAGRSRVGVLDTAGNLIAWTGAYGNQDSAGPGSAIPQPAIPLCWPQAVAADDGHAYVGDRLNRRIVKLALRYHTEATCPVP